MAGVSCACCPDSNDVGREQPTADCSWSWPCQRTDVPRLLEHARSLIDREAKEIERKTSDSRPTGQKAYSSAAVDARQLAVLFPGQGAQYPGMLRELACQFPALHDTLAQACQADEQTRPI